MYTIIHSGTISAKPFLIFQKRGSHKKERGPAWKKVFFLVQIILCKFNCITVGYLLFIGWTMKI